eukprot:5770042-Prorocentrum_lima.AAC.1
MASTFLVASLTKYLPPPCTKGIVGGGGGWERMATVEELVARIAALAAPQQGRRTGPGLGAEDGDMGA